MRAEVSPGGKGVPGLRGSLVRGAQKPRPWGRKRRGSRGRGVGVQGQVDEVEPAVGQECLPHDALPGAQAVQVVGHGAVGGREEHRLRRAHHGVHRPAAEEPLVVQHVAPHHEARLAVDQRRVHGTSVALDVDGSPVVQVHHAIPCGGKQDTMGI